MCDAKGSAEQKKSKGFFAKLMDALDKKMEAKAKKSPCCGTSKDSEDKSCCS